MLDIYFTEEYGKLCELMLGGECCTYELTTDNGTVKNMFIKREVPYTVNGETYFDIVTPYGYGGPIVVECKDKAALLKEYAEDFTKYCAENKIVSEFIRFHSIFKNYEDFTDVYETIYSRHTVGTNLMDYDDPVQGDFSKTSRREVRQAEQNGIECVVNLHPTDLSTFRKLYEETMRRNDADEMYFFKDEYYRYFENELRESILEVQAIFEGEVIGSELYFIKGDVLHAHLLGSGEKLLSLHAGAIIEATAARWGKQNGYRYIHHGGGRTSDPDDALYMYKKKFGKHTEFDFYVGKKIWNTDVYENLLNQRLQNGEIADKNYFPAYRAE